MPRYKAICSCEAEFWVRKSVKLDDIQKLQLTRRSLCPTCAAIYRRRFQDVRSGQFSGAITPEEQQQIDSMIDRLRENRPWGFTRLGPTDDPEDRRATRATTYPGPARSMAAQWGGLL